MFIGLSVQPAIYYTRVGGHIFYAPPHIFAHFFHDPHWEDKMQRDFIVYH